MHVMEMGLSIDRLPISARDSILRGAFEDVEKRKEIQVPQANIDHPNTHAILVTIVLYGYLEDSSFLMTF